MATSRRGPLTGAPANSTSPRVGAIRPAATRSAVVLPQPDGPTMQTISPLRDLEGQTAENELIAEGEDRRRGIQSADRAHDAAPARSDRHGPGSRRCALRAAPAPARSPGAIVAVRRDARAPRRNFAVREARHHQPPVAIGFDRRGSELRRDRRGEPQAAISAMWKPLCSASNAGSPSRKPRGIVADIAPETVQRGDDCGLPGGVAALRC